MNANVANGKFISSGHAPYKDDEKNQKSFFIEIEHEKGGKSKYWGLGLEDALNKTNIKSGDNIALLDKGNIEGTTKREWEIEKYEPALNYQNVIEANEQIKRKKEQDFVQLKTSNLDNEIELPSSIKSNYIAMVKNRLFKDERINFYDKEDSSSIAFEDRKNALNTSREDDKTVKSMIDVAQAKGWVSISLKGTEEFKRKAWLEANLRGIETKGYKPTEQDITELKLKQEERMQNSIQADKIQEINQSKTLETLEFKADDKLDSKQNIENEKMVSLINTYRDELPQQEQGVNKHTGLEKLKLTLDTYKDKISQRDLINIEAYKMVINEKFKDHPNLKEQRLDSLSDKIPLIANNTYKLPNPPTIKQQADVNISTTKQSDQDRSR